MFNSKALKDPDERPPRFPLLRKLFPYSRYTDEDELSFFAKWWYKFKEKIVWGIVGEYQCLDERTRRAWAFAKFAWLNYDFDFHCVYGLMNFKMKRVYKCLKNGHAYQEDEDMKGLKELIKVTKRLSRGDYERKYYRAHDKKWGKIESKTIPEPDKDGKVKYYRWESWRAGTLNASDEVKAQERQETLALYENGEADRVKDINRMAELLIKHADRLWD